MVRVPVVSWPVFVAETDINKETYNGILRFLHASARNHLELLAMLRNTRKASTVTLQNALFLLNSILAAFVIIIHQWKHCIILLEVQY